MGSMQLVQGFRGNPSRPVPALWSQRLGVRRAGDLWKRQGSGLWWQAWSTDGEAYLVLPATLLPRTERSGLVITAVDGLILSGADPLHREQLQQRLASSRPRPKPNLLVEDCLTRLEQGPAVVWSSDGLAAVSGTLAPLLQRVNHGCLSLDLRGESLYWKGVVGQRPLQAAPPSLRGVPSTAVHHAPDQERQPLLTIRGRQLEDVLGALLSRRIIQSPLEAEYGINQTARLQLAKAPFQLRLVELAKGPYQAGLQIQLPLAGGASQWRSTLEQIDDRLQERGMTIETTAANGVQIRDWKRTGSPLVAGWRWLGGMERQPCLASALAWLHQQSV